MSTYKDLQDRIALDYLNRFDLIPEVKRAIQASIRCYEPESWFFQDTATAAVCVISSANLAVPSDFLRLDRIELRNSGSWFKLQERSFDDIRTINATSQTGLPTVYSLQNDNFELAIIPNSAYSAMIYYSQSLPVLSADTDSNAWTNAAFNLIAHDACLDVLNNVIVAPTNSPLRAAHTMALQRALNELESRNIMRLGNCLRATKF